MLGQREHTAPLNKEESGKIRAIVGRIATGNLSEEDCRIIDHYNSLNEKNKGRFIWA